MIDRTLLEGAKSSLAVRPKGGAFGAWVDTMPAGTGGMFGPGWRFSQRPSDQQLLTAFGESPWANKKYLRIAASIASLKVVVGTPRDTPGEQSDLNPLPDTYPLTVLLKRPNPMLDYWSFMFLTMIYARVTGEVYWWKRRNVVTGRPLQVWVMPRMWVKPNRHRDTGELVDYEVAAFGDGRQRVTVPLADMIWLWRPDPLDPYRKGLGDMLSAATEIETFEYASETDRQLFLKGGTPPGALVLPTTPPIGEINRLKDDWRTKHQGFWNRGEVAVLTSGAKYESFQDSRREMQFVQGQQYLRDVIIAGVHPHILGIAEDVNRANAEAAEYTFARWELEPDVIWVTGPLNEGLAAEFDPRTRIQLGDPVPQNRELESVEARDPNTGAIATVDERRAKIGLPPLPNGEGQVRQIDLRVIEVPLGMTMDEATGGPAGAPPAPTPPAGAAVSAVAVKVSPGDIGGILPTVDAETARTLRELVRAYQHVLEGRTELAAQELGITIAFDVRDPAVQRFLREEAGTRIRRITETTLDKVRATLVQGTTAGEAIPDLARRVSSVFDDAKGRRSTVIARTEVLQASNFAAEQAYRESGVVEQIEWLLAPDYTPAIDNGECAPFDGQIVNVGQDFAPGVRFPPLHPQCRCTIAPVIAEKAGSQPISTEQQAAQRGDEGRAQADVLFEQRVGLEFPKIAEAERIFETVATSLRDAGLSANEIQTVRTMGEAWAEGGRQGKEKVGRYLRALFGDPDAPTETAQWAPKYYRALQESLREGIKTGYVTVYRGINGPLAADMTAAFERGQTISLASEGLYRANSWTTSLDLARDFSTFDPFRARSPLILRAVIPVEDIILTPLYSPGWVPDFFNQRELVLANKTGRRLVTRVLSGETKGGAGEPIEFVLPTEMETWHRPGERPKKPPKREPGDAPETRDEPVALRGRRLYVGEARKQHIAQLGREHLIMERRFRSVVVRQFQDQQNRILRALRTL